MKRLIVFLALLLPMIVSAQEILTLPMNITPNITNDFDGHAGYTIAQGTDYGMSIGTTVVAASGGTVYTYDNDMDNNGGETGGYGNYIIIDHGTINGQAWETRYAHLSTGTFVVGNGQYVSRGQPLAESGNSGFSTGAHLHFEVRIDDTPVDPYDTNDWLWITNPPTHSVFNPPTHFDLTQGTGGWITGFDALFYDNDPLTVQVQGSNPGIVSPEFAFANTDYPNLGVDQFQTIKIKAKVAGQNTGSGGYVYLQDEKDSWNNPGSLRYGTSLAAINSAAR